MQHPSHYHRSILHAESHLISRPLRSVAAAALVVLLLCLPASPSQAQQIPASQWAVFRQIDGLLATDLHVVLPANGAIWFGGQNGVSRFDGTWTTYPLTDQAKTARADAAEDPASLVRAMAVDTDQNLSLEVWQEAGPGKYGYVQVFTHPRRHCLAIEPMTCAPNAFQNGMGLVVLQPGQSLLAACGVALAKPRPISK